MITLPDISIHAPVKGATCKGGIGDRFADISIHAPVKGATDNEIFRVAAVRNFNPRTREGCDGGPAGCLWE